MIKLKQEQHTCKQLLETLILAPTSEFGGLPRLQETVEKWYEISLQSPTSNTRRNPVPIVEFTTKTGQGCVTATQLILMNGIFSTQVQVYDLVDVDVQHTPQHRLTKISLLSNAGQRLGGFNPMDTKVAGLVQTIQTLKQLQEA